MRKAAPFELLELFELCCLKRQQRIPLFDLCVSPQWGHTHTHKSYNGSCSFTKRSDAQCMSRTDGKLAARM